MKDLKQINDDLDNWRNYYRDRTKQRITFSLEGRFRPDRKDIDYEEEALPPATKPVDVKLAVIYEIAICKLPFQNKFCLAVEYFYKWALNDKHFKKTCKIGGIGGKNDWELQLKKAKLMLINRRV